MKSEFITKYNYKKFKPSEFIRSFISDVDVAIEIGKPMDMGNYSQNWSKTCLPCLGGMACMNMNVRPGTSIGYNLAQLGDAIRIERGGEVKKYLEKLYSFISEKDPRNRNVIVGGSKTRT